VASQPSVFSTVQPSFNAGELSPLLFGRVDIEKYKSGLALARNVYVDYRGGLSNRAGTQYIDTINGSGGAPHLIPFVVNVTTTYVLVFTGNNLIKFYSNGAYVAGADLASPYAIADLPDVKFNQSADVLTLTHPLYPVFNVTRTGPSTFSIDEDVIGPIILPPTSLTAHLDFNGDTTAPTTGGAVKGYVVTAVSADGKEESIPTFPVYTTGISLKVPTPIISLQWVAPAFSVSRYKIYSVPHFPDRGVTNVSPSPSPTVFGYIGSSTGTTFTDSNITPDFSQTPPQLQDPFSPGQVASVTVATGGSGYSSGWIATLVFTGGGGAGAAGFAVINPRTSTIVGVVLTNPGKGYATPPVVTDTVGSATYNVTLGQQAGTYPTASTYFQQRLVYGGTNNFPESLVMSVTGKYKNFDTSPITQANDSITVSISSTQNNSIVSLVPMPTGLVTFTEGSAFLLTGGSQSSAVSPSSIVALPQASFGASNLPPIPVNYTVLYTERLGFTVRDLTFNFYNQSYVGVDRSILSSHLFFGHSFIDWAFCEAPFRMLFMTRDDGEMLALSYVPEQELYAWTHYDTNGQFVSACSVPEGQQNTLYVITRRFIQGSHSWVYFLERFVERIFDFPIDQGMWFVDAGLAFPQRSPNVAIQPSGTGPAINFTFPGTIPANPGDIIQAYGCQIVLTAVATGSAAGQLLFGSLPTIPNDPFLTPIPLTPGNWTVTTPVQNVTGLGHLEGMKVTGVADGVVIPLTTVVGGAIRLQQPATSIIVGLGYTAQVQTLKLTSQSVEEGKRKNIPALSLRQYQTAGIQIGKDFAHLNPQKSIFSPMNPQVQLISDDIRSIIGAHWAKDGQVAIQQDLPLPMTILADIPEVVPGDTYRG
jgi:hypothetical protein